MHLFQFFSVLFVLMAIGAPTVFSEPDPGRVEILIYEQTGGEGDYTYRDRIEHTGSGYRVSISSEVEKSVLLLDAQWNTLEWRYSVPRDDTDLTFRQEGKKLVGSGQWKGEDFSKSFRISSSPWYQFQEVSLQAYWNDLGRGRRAGDGKGSEVQKFWTIDRLNMEAVEFQVEFAGQEKIEVPAGTFSAYRLRLKLTGFLSLFWEAGEWIRESDGRFLQLHIPEDGDRPASSVQLASERVIE